MERVETPAQTAPVVEIDIDAAINAAPAQTPVIDAVNPVAAIQEQSIPTPEVQQVYVAPEDDMSALNVIPETVDASVAVAVVEETKLNAELAGTEIASVKSAFWGSFLKSIETVSPGLGAEDVVSINEGQLIASKAGGVIKCDLSNVFGKNTWNIKDPNLQLKLLKLIRGGDKVTILDDGNKNIIYSSTKNQLEKVATFIKPNTKNFKGIVQVDVGEPKFTTAVSVDNVSDLVAAKGIHDALYYNVTIDVNTYEVLSIDVDDKYNIVIKSDTARETMRYKVQELFPVKKPDSIILDVYDKDGTIFFRTSNDFVMTTIFYQIPAMVNPKRDDLDFDAI